MEQETPTGKRVTITDSRYESIFSLASNPETTLQVYSRELKTDYKSWGAFKLQDLDSRSQSLFESIRNLFEYIACNTEELELGKNLVKINLNFLTQSKEIELRLNRMVMCSHEEQEKTAMKILQLENENRMLRSCERNNNGLSGKLTLPLSINTFNTLSYEICNFMELKPVAYARATNVFLQHEMTEIPKEGQAYFHIVVSGMNYMQGDAKPFPLIEIGVRNEQHQKCIVTLASNFEEQLFEIDEKDEISEVKLCLNDFIKVTVDTANREVVVIRNFNDSRVASWQNTSGSKWWLYMRLWRVSIKTDLFLNEGNEGNTTLPPITHKVEEEDE